MSETPLGSDDIGLAPLHEALVGFTGCIGDAVADICSYGLTIGETYVPFDPDPEDNCEDEEVSCSQLWVRVMNAQPVHLGEGWAGDCGGVMQLTLEVGVLRCVEVPEGGEAPTASSVLASALQAMDDMNAIYCAAMDCEVWDSIESGAWEPTGPLGGQYGGIWTFTVEVPNGPNPAGVLLGDDGIWTGHGPPPANIPGASNGDEYLDLDTGDVYTLNI